MDIKEYYKNKYIKERMQEFLAGEGIGRTDAVYVTRSDRSSYSQLQLFPPPYLESYMNEGVDIARSLWDREHIIAHLDIEYVNYDFQAEPFLDPVRAFTLQEPVIDAIENILKNYNISYLHLLTGRGHHFVWQVSFQSEAFKQLISIGYLPDHLKEYYAQPHPPTNESISAALGKAFSGLGLILEYVAYHAKAEAEKHCLLPVEITAVTVSPHERGREMISVDISEYGDPLNTRLIRIPFSIYRKPWEKNWFLNSEMEEKIPLIFFIPLNGMVVNEGLDVMRDMSRTLELAKNVSVQIPCETIGMEKLITDYKRSCLERYHIYFYSQEHEPPWDWPVTYDRVPLDELPPCISYMLRNPNDLLLKPAEIRHLVRVLMAKNWHPRHIAGLLRSKYERNYGWGLEWYTYNAGMRADFYCRIFAGLIFLGKDNLDDFHCTTMKETKVCMYQQHVCDLEEYRLLLLNRFFKEGEKM